VYLSDIDDTHRVIIITERNGRHLQCGRPPCHARDSAVRSRAQRPSDICIQRPAVVIRRF